MSSWLKIDPRDDVAVALAPLAAGELVADGVRAAVDIPAGHKVALRALAPGEAVAQIRLADRACDRRHRARRPRAQPQPGDRPIRP